MKSVFRGKKGQIERLQNDRDVLKAYDAVIKEQAAFGIVERVPELETPEKIHYLPHHTVYKARSGPRCILKGREKKSVDE